MTQTDISYLATWIGKTEQARDIVTPGLVERFRATFGSRLAESADAPSGIHWCLAPPAAAEDMLGEDGHPRRGGFLPPVPLPRRMWAGAQVEFIAPIRIGATVDRASRVLDVAEKSGRSGRLVFVVVEHVLSCDGETVIRERHDIVYREAATGAPVSQHPVEPDAPAQVTESVEATTTLLFRYSALTFNGHRIHYDLDYVRDVEGYPGLVVHGPLQATLLMHLAARLSPGRRLRKIAFRGVAPLCHGDAFTLNANGAGADIQTWTADARGAMTMTLSANFA